MRETAALLLAGVFLVAGGAKLFDLAGTRRSVRELGLPAALGWPVAIALPLVELGLAAGLVVEATSRGAAAAAAVLLAVFAAAIAVNVLRGRTADCGCFGPLHSSRAGFPAAARNGVLALLALALAGSAARPVGWGELGVALVIAALAAQAAAWVVLLRRYGQALRRIDELEPHTESEAEESLALELGAEAPPFAFPGLDGASVALGDLLADARPVALVVTDERCGACTTLYPEIARWQRELDDQVTVAVLADGSPDKLRAIAQEHELDQVLHADRATLQAYGVYGTPSALLIDADGRVASPVRYGELEIEALVLDAAESRLLEVTHHG
jgi:peroxiredoxin